MGDIRWFIRGLVSGDIIGRSIMDASFIPYPVTIGGLGGIGVRLSSAEYIEGHRTYALPLYAGDVDTVFTGFNINLKWDTSQVQLVGIQSVDSFDAELIDDDNIEEEPDVLDGNIHYSIGNGQAYILSTGKKGVEYKEDLVFCNLIFTIVSDPPTLSNPFMIDLGDNNDNIIIPSTLLHWQYYIEDDEYYLTMVEPTINSGGGIYSELPDITGDLFDTNLPVYDFGEGLYITQQYYNSTTYPATVALNANTGGENFKRENILSVAFILKYEDIVGKISSNASYATVAGFDGYAGTVRGVERPEDMYMCGIVYRTKPGVVVKERHITSYTQSLIAFLHFIIPQMESFVINVTGVAVAITMYNESNPSVPLQYLFMKDVLTYDEQMVIDIMNGNYELLENTMEYPDIGTIDNTMNIRGNTYDIEKQ